jgi:Spy/CpxP family protein refolding chaperone
MKKVSLTASLVLLLVLVALTWSFAQMEMKEGSKHVIKMIGDETTFQGKCGGHSGGGMHQMGCCKMASGMMGQMGCSKMCSGMKMCGGMMGCEGEMNCCKKGFFLCCKKELELTKKQVKDLKSIKMDFQKGKLMAEANLKIAQLELRSLMHEDDASIKDIEAKLKEAAKLKTDMKLSHIKAFRKAKALLTPEQLEKMKKHHEK